MNVLFYLNHGWQRYIAWSPHLLVAREAERDPDCTLEWAEDLACPPEARGFDAIVTDACPAAASWLARLSVPKLCMETDIHRWTRDEHVNFTECRQVFDAVLTPHRFAVPADWVHASPLSDRANMVLFPHCVPNGPPPVAARDRGAIYCGTCRSPSYPFRGWCDSLGLGYDVPQHPGYMDPETMVRLREEYWPLLAGYHIGLAGQVLGPRGYATAKYFDIPYAGCLLIAEEPIHEERRALGLVDGSHCFYVRIGEESKLRCLYMEATGNPEWFASIAAAGQRLVRQRHNVAARMAHLKRLVAYVQEHGRGIPPARQFDLLESA
jgi:hypothetical protein